jgi:Zn-dependent protease with chaperone function
MMLSIRSAARRWLPVAVLLAGCATAPREAAPLRAGGLREAADDERGRVARLLAPLVGLSGLRPGRECPIALGVIRTPAVNAAVGRRPGCPDSFALALSEGAFERLTDLELQAMLAHELGHVRLGHFDRAQARARLRDTTGPTLGVVAAVVSALPFVGPIVGVGVTAAQAVAPFGVELGVKAFSRRDEAEADRFAARLLERTGGATGCLALASLFERLESGGSSEAVWLSTHPSPADRAETTRTYCAGDRRD